MKPWMSVASALIMISCIGIMIYSWFSIHTITQKAPAQENLKLKESFNRTPISQYKTTEKKVSQSKKTKPEQKILKTSYNIVSSKSHNYHTTYGKYISHKDYRVVVPVKTTRTGLNLIAKTITASESSNINSLRIWFYWPESDPTGVYTAGMATCDFINNDWRIEMKYCQGYSKTTPQYSSNSGIQSIARRKKIFWDLVVVEDRAGMNASPKQCQRVIAKRYGISVSEVEKILGEAVRKGWPMPKDPLY